MYLGDLVELGSNRSAVHGTRETRTRGIHRWRLRMRPAAAAFAAGLIVLGASGCETTQEQSAKIARTLGHQSAIAGTTAPRRRQPRRADRTGGAAHDRRPVGGRAEADQHEHADPKRIFPVLIEVLDAKGSAVYRTTQAGSSPRSSSSHCWRPTRRRGGLTTRSSRAAASPRRRPGSSVPPRPRHRARFPRSPPRP